MNGEGTILLIPSSKDSCTVHEQPLTGTDGMRDLHAQEWHFVVVMLISIVIPFRLDGIGERPFPPTCSMASAVTLVSHGDTESSTRCYGRTKLSARTWYALVRELNGNEQSKECGEPSIQRPYGRT